MHVQHSVHVERDAKDCAAALKDGPRWWFPHLDGEGLGKVKVRLMGVKVSKKVKAELGEVVTVGDWTKVRMAWKATFPTALFPVMEGEVELSPHDKGTTRLTVSGMYEPPLGKVGAWLDEAVMHNVAQATVKQLAEDIAERLR